MAGMLSGDIMIAAFGLVAVAGLILAVALYRISRRPHAGYDTDSGRAEREGG